MSTMPRGTIQLESPHGQLGERPTLFIGLCRWFPDFPTHPDRHSDNLCSLRLATRLNSSEDASGATLQWFLRMGPVK